MTTTDAGPAQEPSTHPCGDRLAQVLDTFDPALTAAIGKARADVRSGRTLAVPAHLRDSHYKGAKSLGHGAGYQYSHDHPDAIAADQDYLPEPRVYYEPSGRGFEAEIQKRLEEWARRRAKGNKKSE